MPLQTSRKRHPRHEKQFFSSRRNISKSEPQAQSQMDGTEEQEGDAEVGPRPSGRGAILSRRRSSAPNEELSASSMIHQDSHGRSQERKTDDGSSHVGKARKSTARSSEITDAGEEREIVALANSLATETKK